MLRGKVVVITGSSSGTGAAAARQLHALGATVVPVGGSRERTERVARDLGLPVRTVDFRSLASVERCAAAIRRDFGRVDVLALNAGGVVTGGEATVDGLEPNLQLNAIGPWLLLQLLEDRLGGGRVVATSSRSHVGATLDFEKLEDGRGWSWHGVYARTKLLHGVLLREFGRRQPDIDVGDFHPGIVASDMGRYLGRVGSILKWGARPFFRSPSDAARHLVALADRPDALAGRYFVDDEPSIGSPLLQDRASGSNAWRWAERMLATHLAPGLNRRGTGASTGHC